MKIIIRETYKKELSLGWDDDLPIELKKKWVQVLQLLKEAESLKFRRCITYSNSIGDPELIVFCDGSKLAMCAAKYIRWLLDTNEYVCQLVASKAKVTPVEGKTTPRAEMDAAVLAVRLGKTVVNSCRTLKFKEVIHISDSTCTIATIINQTSALKEYMGNRAGEIRRKSKPENWFHVKSGDNIADLGTRMEATIDDIKSGSEWQCGPEWCKLDRSEWPVTQDIGPEHIPPEELAKPKLCSLATKTTPLIDIDKFRSYDRLMRVTARILRIFQKKSFKNNNITPESLEKAEEYWIKESMKLTTEEYKKGNLASLRPRLREDGIIVLSTRALKGLKSNYNQDTFPILSRNDPLAKLWIRKIHFEDHTGVTRTVAKSRRKFWIPRARKIAQSLRHSCYVCRLLDKQLAMQQMCPLPDDRLAIAPVFNKVSMDLFGPKIIRDTVKKRTTMKVWGVIFTCKATRAVYLDITDSYSTDSILQVLDKFISQRGCPSEITSDQGSQLVAASQDIAELTKNWNWNKVSDWASDNKIHWKFVPAEAQHQNGLSESLIRSVKRSISHVVGSNELTFSELQLAFYKISDIINSRPIGIVSGSDPDDPSPITPNDLILGRSNNGVPPGPFNTKVTIAKRYSYVQTIVDEWWKRWIDSVLPTLVPSYKWQQRHRNVKVGDVCLIRYKGIRSTYRLGRVIEAKPGPDGLVRTIRLQYKLPGEKKFRAVDRAVQGVAVIVPIEEQ